jgi:hypothetical protein
MKEGVNRRERAPEVMCMHAGETLVLVTLVRAGGYTTISRVAILACSVPESVDRTLSDIVVYPLT